MMSIRKMMQAEDAVREHGADADSDWREVYEIARSLGYNHDDAFDIATDMRGQP